MKQDPIMIVGISPRSGTNLLFYHLASNPSCTLPITMFECNIFEDLNVTNRQIEEAITPELASSYDLRTVLKTPICTNVSRILDVYPDTKFVIIIRNGKYIVESMYRSSKNMECGRIPQMYFYSHRAEQLQRTLPLVPNYALVQYEELISNPSKVVNDLCTSIGIVPPSHRDIM